MLSTNILLESSVPQSSTILSPTLLNSFTLKENFDARINLTLRTCTGFTEEDETKYQTDVYVARIIENKNNKQ